jgi:predicted metal-binding protein
MKEPMDTRKKIEELVKKHNVKDFKWMDPHKFVVEQWVRMKCLFGCDGCPGKLEKCKDPKKARPTPEALGVDVYATVRQIGYPIEVLSDYSQTMNRYAFLLIE